MTHCLEIMSATSLRHNLCRSLQGVVQSLAQQRGKFWRPTETRVTKGACEPQAQSEVQSISLWD